MIHPTPQAKPTPSRRSADGECENKLGRFFRQGWLTGSLVAAATLSWAAQIGAVESDPDTAADRAVAIAHHTVVEGDTIYAIANRYGSSVELVVEANGIEDVLALNVGSRLTLPLIANPRRSAGAVRQVRARGPAAPDVERLLERSEVQLREARFESALELAESSRAALNARNAPSDDPRRVQLELVSATAHVALGRSDAALDSLERALLADPNLDLDPAVTSPRVMAVFYVARRRILPTP